MAHQHSTTSDKDQSEADWGDWSMNNDGGVGQLDVEVKQELVDDEQKLTAYDEEPQRESTDFQMYDDEAGVGSGSCESEGSDMEDMEEGGELQKELLSRTDRGPLGLLQPQGMVMCEFCGRLGVRDAFYSKTKRFCSVSCSKNFLSSQKDGKPTPFTLLQASMSKGKPKGNQSYLKSKLNHGNLKLRIGSSKPFDWSLDLNRSTVSAAPVSCFKHCLMADSWDNIAVGMKVEVINTDCDLPGEAYWIATVIQLAGYRAQMRYEGFGNDVNQDFWINLCTKDVHPVGWCAANRKPLVPPQTIQHKYLDWKDFLVKRLTGARTLPQNFYNKVQEALYNSPIKTSFFVEVVDKMCVSAMRVARVEEYIGGRLKVHYVDSKVENDEFWCHQESPLVHPVGWSYTVGHKLHSSPEYRTEAAHKVQTKKYGETDGTPDMFPKVKDVHGSGKFQVGMKLEAIDPLNLSSICVASVMKVLKNNYLMIGIDGSTATDGSDWFCYHATSPCIFPVGFCEINSLDLMPPRTHKGPFKWFDYLKQTKSAAAPVKLFDKVIPRHGFKVGQKLEAVDLMEPRLICVATVKKLVGRLLRIHFDGWEDSYDQWVDCASADIYPVGWCEMVGYHLEGPRMKVETIQSQMMVYPKKRKSKSQIYRGPRKSKKRKPKSMPVTPILTRPGSRSLLPQNSLDSSDISQDSFSLASDANLTPGGSTAGFIPVKEDAVSGCEELPDDQGVEKESSSGAKPLTSERSQASALASSVPSIANMLNSPVVQQQATASSLPQPKPSISKPTPTKPAAIPATVSQVFTVQPLQGQSAVYSLSSPGSPGSSTVHMTPVFTHNIPRLLPGEPEKDCLPPVVVTKDKMVYPEKWNVYDVCQFLRVNDCGAHCESFRKKGTDGPKFLNLTKEQIVNLTGMKVGPSLKIYDLIQALKKCLVQQQGTGDAAVTQAAAGEDTTERSDPGHITASVLLKQQGLLQQGSPSTTTLQASSTPQQAQLLQ